MKKNEKTSTKKRAATFAIVGIVLALFNFLVYTFLARVVMNSNELLWLDSLLACFLATFLAFFMHSKITWKERQPTEAGIIKFFLWNFLIALIISPFLTWLFKLITPLYEFLYSFTTNIHLPFDYNFIESTSVFILTTCITMILNFIFYDRIVFGKPRDIEPAPLAKDTSKKVSVIVPIYNTSKYLKKCLDSIVGQSYQNLEIILVDDGSIDDSGKIADKYGKKDPRVKVIHQKNQGQSAARNHGLKLATGDFISFIDSDDWIDKDFISKLLAPYEDSNTSVTVCGMHYKRLKNHSAKSTYIAPIRAKRKHETKKAYLLYLLAIDGRMYSSVNKLYDASTAKKCHFDENLEFAEDTKFVFDYLAKTNGNPKFVLEPLYIYNFGTESSTINRTAIDWHNWQVAYQNLKIWLGPHSNLPEKFWLHAVHLRWRVSFIRSKRRATKA